MEFQGGRTTIAKMALASTAGKKHQRKQGQAIHALTLAKLKSTRYPFVWSREKRKFPGFTSLCTIPWEQKYQVLRISWGLILAARRTQQLMKVTCNQTEPAYASLKEL